MISPGCALLFLLFLTLSLVLCDVLVTSWWEAGSPAAPDEQSSQPVGSWLRNNKHTHTSVFCTSHRYLSLHKFRLIDLIFSSRIIHTHRWHWVKETSSNWFISDPVSDTFDTSWMNCFLICIHLHWICFSVDYMVGECNTCISGLSLLSSEWPPLKCLSVLCFPFTRHSHWWNSCRGQQASFSKIQWEDSLSFTRSQTSVYSVISEQAFVPRCFLKGYVSVWAAPGCSWSPAGTPPDSHRHTGPSPRSPPGSPLHTHVSTIIHMDAQTPADRDIWPSRHHIRLDAAVVGHLSCVSG